MAELACRYRLRLVNRVSGFKPMHMQRKRTFKKMISTIHLWLGLTSGIVVFVVALTGATFVFEEEGREAFLHAYYHINDTTGARLPMDQILDSFRMHYPKEKIASFRFKENKDAAFVFVTENKLISVNPVTGAITGVREKSKDFFTVIQKIHTELYMGETGKTIVHINVLIFFILVISGVILWFPHQKKFSKQAVTIDFKTKNKKRLVWDLHRVLGFYAMLVLLIISLTGLFFAFDTVKSLGALLTTGTTTTSEKKKPTPVAPLKTQTSLQAMYVFTQQQYPGASEVFITPATKKDATVRIIMRYPYTVVRKQNTVYFDANTGKVIAETELYKKYNGYDNLARSNYDFHTGRIRFLGIGSKIIYFLSALIAASLPVTGFLFWLGRKRKKKNPTLRKASTTTTTAVV